MNSKASPAGKTDIGKSLKYAAGFSFILFIIKLLTFISTGSLLLLASVFDSLADSVNSMINHYIYKVSRVQADQEHPFGHGGFEVVGSLIQGLIIVFLGAGLMQESVRKMLDDSVVMENHNQLPIAAAVLIFSALGGYFIQFYLQKKIKDLEKNKERSLSLLSDKAHYTGDAVVNLLASAGVMAIYWSQAIILDGFFGALGSLFLMTTGYPILKKVFRDIVHKEAPVDLQQQIINHVFSTDPRIRGVHQFRSRELGPHLFVDFHMKVPDQLSVRDAHDLATTVQNKITDYLPRTDVLIHIDPESEKEPPSWSPSWDLPDSAPNPKT